MRLLISSDWHLDSGPLAAYRFDLIEKTLPKMIKQHQPEMLLFLGDVCERKDAHKAELVNRVTQVFHDLAQLVPVVALQGNHDYQSGPDNPFFGFLGRLEGVVWVGAPTPLTSIETLPAGLPDVPRAILLPHSSNPARDWAEIDFEQYDFAFTHQFFTGAVAESGFKLAGGTPLSIFPPHLRVISGDIHRPQTMGKLTYVGAPYAVDFGDDYEPRMLLMEDSKLISLPCDGPSKQLIHIRTLDDLKKVGGLLPQDILKVRVDLDPDQADRWPEIKEAVREWGAKRGLLVHQVLPVRQGNGSSMMKVDGASVRSDEELLRDYAGVRVIGADILKAGLKFL